MVENALSKISSIDLFQELLDRHSILLCDKCRELGNDRIETDRIGKRTIGC
jgi:hypothetical protein